ncbi:MAG TPA: hypothetical protein VEP90_19915 [Methylomirabilota bacterium]|nr:hypothetical protein [Methylomirabilota bacterium]
MAIKDKIGEEELNCYVSVGIGLIAIYKPQTGKYFKGYPTTGKIRRFLRNFDAQIIPVKPFEFELLEENTL